MRERVWSDEEISEALRIADGRVPVAARRLDCHVKTIYERVRLSPLIWPAGIDRKGPGRPGASDDLMRAALRLAGGNQSEAARILGVRRQSVCMRLIARPQVWPTELPRAAKAVRP